ncbi:NOP5 family protein [Heterostelium album PN500]|uniref:Nucleolar protein 56 n=1 Tax=Heterostelium pallidum (strain ATCC 26659 / Pp 5 / PN500) TaxID=670386 RepID=D3BCL2_HETP5|nr:NOP5 family protein [Heterostelium album PN500]EFA80654.1 NOP5 family protein [Heterostelium album PN500]|eukprot:XP_020432774.1 NOP5 family protein [Heterostelium album PN500]
MATHILFETSTGFNIFSLSETEQIQNASVQKSMQDFDKFSKSAKLIGELPFTSAQEALENINSISEGMLTDSLKSFLKQTLKKSSGVVLGVSDNKLAASIQESTAINCISNALTHEVLRCIRLHVNSFTKLKDRDLVKAQLGLGHSYSRSKVKFNVHKVDNMIIQAISTLEQLDKDLNTFHMRVREWYAWHFPELIKIVKENIHFARLVKLIENKTSLNEEMIDDIKKIVGDDEQLAKDIFSAGKSSMGTDISTIDLESIIHFADRVISLHEYRDSLEQYLTKKMRDIAPNLQTLIGDRVGAQLIARAGSLTNLAKYPASTVQILGAEKALFRAIKVRGKTPKYGIIYKSGFISKATPKNKGRISRCLANKVSIATRIDCFSENPTDKFGLTLKKQVDDRLEFFTSGVSPKRNLDVMREVIKEVEKDFSESNKRSADDMDEVEEKPSKKSSSKKQKVEKEEKKEKKEEKEEKKSSSKKDKKEKKEDAMEVDEKPKKKKKEEKEEKEEKKSSSKKDKKEEKEEKKSSSKKDKKEEKKSSSKKSKE